ncbi:MAG: hypothetical protein EOO09_22535 [Chitinophagaceae bacterium]|nr:MAG: hypothetical protein EOO09_22535 [Chitinophagaceae bacterium]
MVRWELPKGAKGLRLDRVLTTLIQGSKAFLFINQDSQSGEILPVFCSFSYIRMMLLFISGPHIRLAAGKAFKEGQTFNLNNLSQQLAKLPGSDSQKSSSADHYQDMRFSSFLHIQFHEYLYLFYSSAYLQQKHNCHLLAIPSEEVHASQQPRFQCGRTQAPRLSDSAPPSYGPRNPKGSETT